MHTMSALNAFHALSNIALFSTGFYDLSKQKKSKTTESMMISFGILGALAYLWLINVFDSEDSGQPSPKLLYQQRNQTYS